MATKCKVERDSARARGERTSTQVVGTSARGVEASRNEIVLTQPQVHQRPQSHDETIENARHQKNEQAAKVRVDQTTSLSYQPPQKKKTTKDVLGNKGPRGDDNAPFVWENKTVQTILTKQMTALPPHPSAPTTD